MYIAELHNSCFIPYIKVHPPLDCKGFTQRTYYCVWLWQVGNVYPVIENPNDVPEKSLKGRPQVKAATITSACKHLPVSASDASNSFLSCQQITGDDGKRGAGGVGTIALYCNGCAVLPTG